MSFLGIKEWVFEQVVERLLKKVVREDSMNGQKPWYQSKTILSGIVTTILSIYQIGSTVLAPLIGVHLPPIPEWLITALGAVLGGITIYGRSTATTTIQ